MKSFSIFCHLIIGLIIFLNPPDLFAKVRTPNAAVGENISIQVKYGDRVTYFDIQSDSNQRLLILNNNEGLHRSKKLSEADFEFLKNQYMSLPKESNDPQFCPRQYIKAQFSNQTKLGCLGGQNKMAQSLMEIVNLLSLQF
jgi:hypothetical protein